MTYLDTERFYIIHIIFLNLIIYTLMKVIYWPTMLCPFFINKLVYLKCGFDQSWIFIKLNVFLHKILGFHEFTAALLKCNVWTQLFTWAWNFMFFLWTLKHMDFKCFHLFSWTVESFGVVILWNSPKVFPLEVPDKNLQQYHCILF